MNVKLGNYPDAWVVGVHAVGSMAAYDGIIYVCTVARTASHTNNPTVDTASWSPLGSGSGGTTPAAPTPLSFNYGYATGSAAATRGRTTSDTLFADRVKVVAYGDNPNANNNYRFFEPPSGYNLISAVGESGQTIASWTRQSSGTYTQGPLRLRRNNADVDVSETFVMIVEAAP